jgi:SAM-dependent methyltransferase
MLLRARQAAAAAPRGSLRPVAGDMERLPVGDGRADLVVANASFNLAVDQRAAFAEAARILRPGGRLVCRELIREGALPAELGQDPMGWNASLGGVMEAEALRATVRAAGFTGVKISHHRPFPPVVAVRLEAVRPGSRDPAG